MENIIRFTYEKTNYEFTDSLSSLDPYILFIKILKPILGIEDLKNDHRITYLPGRNETFDVKKSNRTKENLLLDFWHVAINHRRD